jgi:hypothetical protein
VAKEKYFRRASASPRASASLPPRVRVFHFFPPPLSLFARLPHRAAAALTSLQIGHASWMEDALSDRGGRPALDTSLPLSRRQPHRYPLPQHRRLGFAIESPPPQISSIAPAATPPATVLLSSRRRRTPLLTSSHRTAVDPFSQAPRSLCPSLPPRSTHGWDVRSPLHLTHPSHGRGHRCSIRIRDCATSARGPCRRILSLHAELQARRFQRLCSRWTSTNCSLSLPRQVASLVARPFICWWCWHGILPPSSSRNSIRVCWLWFFVVN